MKTEHDAYHIKVATESGKMIECSGGHQLLVQTDNYSEPEFLVADLLLMLAEHGTDLLPALVTETGLETIAGVEKVVNTTNPSQVEFYDLVNVGNGFKYYSNGVVSHNCAHIENFGELWTGLFSTLSTGGKAILFSCVTKDTMVLTPNGPRSVGSFMGGLPQEKTFGTTNYEVYGMNGSRKGQYVWNNGKVATKIIRTVHTHLEASHNHKLWCYNPESKQALGWVRADEIVPGKTWVYNSYGHDVWGSNDDVSDFVHQFSNKEWNNRFHHTKLTPDLCYLLGLYISEGSSFKKYNSNGDLVGATITITCGDDISGVFDALGINVSCHDNIHYTFGSKSFVAFMEYLGFDLNVKAKDKHIPERLLSISRENMIDLIRGIYDGDGGGQKGRSRVMINSTSKKLIDQLRVLLLNFGVLSLYSFHTIEELNKRKKRIPHRNDNHRLVCEGNEAYKFFDRIGFRMARKQANIQYASKRSCRKLGSCPIYRDAFRDIFATLGITSREFAKNHNWAIGVYLSGVCTIGPEELRKLCGIVKKELGLLPTAIDATVQEYMDLGAERGRWELVKTVIDSENETYDFSLPDNDKDLWAHSVIYNNLLGHQTPKGKGHFFTLWQGAETKETEHNKAGVIYKGEGKNGFHAIKLPWTVHPERGQDWFEEQCAALDDRGVAQELLCSFEGSSTSFFNDESIEYVRACMIPPALTIPIMIANKNTGEAHVWKTPVPGHGYVLSADIARGDADDFSTFYIFDTTTSEAVVEYRGKLPPDRYATVLDEWGRKYNMAKVAIELNNTGLSTSIALKNLKYPNLYYPPEIEERLVSMTEDEKASVYPGLTIGSDNRDRILQFMEQNIRSRKVRIFSERFLGEMETFIWNGKRGQAQKKKHDDLIMAAAIGMQMFSPNADLPSMFAASSGNASTLATAMLAGMGRSSTPGGIRRVGYARFAANTTSKQSLENEMLLRKEFGWLYKQ